MLKLVGLLAAGASVASGSWLPDIITADVAIVGAGASGSYAAIRLKEDFKQSIVVIDKADHLVGDHHRPPRATLLTIPGRPHLHLR